ncbi:hypothetical protein [Clostridium ganghwense]|uniref:Bacteriophage lysin domain-containing protein n=1 Tax=Clostridium ganghwense TaxID=312089 RepID=A0ABT4CMP4_9CLOT|nr:hypothetical protein [Clostridium ganghwense]MCY6369506.1 hypothetical protein [Clostridium ganghwense]
MSKKKNFNNYLSNLETNEETKKYIKEMHEMEDKNEKRSNLIFASIAVPIVLVCAFTVKQIFSFSISLAKSNTQIEQSKNLANAESNENKSTAANTDTSKEETKKESAKVGALNSKIYNYLKEKSNRTDSLNKAKALNNGSDKGISTTFIAEILRDNGFDIPKSTINTKRFVSELEKAGWKKVSDYNKLEKGDVCFTTVSSKTNAPTHTYIFMGWIEEGKTDYANICDSQISEYKDTLHKRNIDASTPKKDKFSFFMRKEK